MAPTPSLAAASIPFRMPGPRRTSRSALEALRVPVSFLFALVLTSGMFWALARLINSKVDVGELQKAAKIDFSRLRRDSEIKMIKRQKAEPVKPVEPPPDAPKITAAEAAALASAPPMAGPIALGPGTGLNVDVKGMLGGSGPLAVAGGGGGADRNEMPLVRIQPDYPARALERGIEGWAMVEFTISPTGTTKDVAAVASEPPDTFEQAAVRAVQSWKYNPKIQGGTAIERRGVRVKLDFKINR
jgi:periplasmic protein TonB